MAVYISIKMTYFLAERGRQITLNTIIIEHEYTIDEDFCYRHLEAFRRDNTQIAGENLFVEARVRKVIV